MVPAVASRRDTKTPGDFVEAKIPLATRADVNLIKILFTGDLALPSIEALKQLGLE